ncbi:hypothetical protein CONLIGDRAFT_629756, partial [Coniochaeta ligniaria NRRL 30616]
MALLASLVPWLTDITNTSCRAIYCLPKKQSREARQATLLQVYLVSGAVHLPDSAHGSTTRYGTSSLGRGPWPKNLGFNAPPGPLRWIARYI